jgi:hypothetical protein
MADTPPINPLPGTPSGAEPLKKSTGKVQPKKETVRINLPPKPTAAPTIKLPTLPPGGPTGAPIPLPSSMSAAAPAPAVRPVAAPAAPAAAARPAAAPATAAAPRPVAVTPRPNGKPAAPSISALDSYLVYGAAVASLVAVGGVLWVFFALKGTIETFSS